MAANAGLILAYISVLIRFVIEVAIVSVIAYFVIKKAVKAALREWDKERRGGGPDDHWK